jgi:hypothetical protein
MSKKITVRDRRVLSAAALVLLSQGAWSDDGQAPRSESAAVSLPLPAALASVHAKIEAEVRAHVEALNRRLAEELARRLEEDMRSSCIELVMAEVPTRG